MLTLLLSLRDCFRARAVLQAEILALRHQLLVLQRSSRLHKLCLYWADRVLWVWLSRLWNDWRSALLLVKPETVIAWHRKGFRLYWRWKSRHLEGRPSVSNEVRNLIRKMSLANFRWGTRASMVQENEIENGDAAFDEAELMLPPVPQVFLLDSAVQSARERWWTTPPGRLSVRVCRRPWSLQSPVA
jgi:hypothetical protein